jgi:hypothetical protein
MNGTSATEATGAVTGGLRTLLRLEGLTLFAGMTLLYGVWGGSWWIFLVLFLAPDLSFAAYLGGPRWGAIGDNAAHSTLAPIVLMAAGFGLAAPLLTSLDRQGCVEGLTTPPHARVYPGHPRPLPKRNGLRARRCRSGIAG